MQDHPVWVLVADAHQGRVLERAAVNSTWEELQDEGGTEQILPSRALGTDRPGRVYESVGQARHSVEPRQDLHDAMEMDFAHGLARKLEDAAAAGRYKRLYVMAPPRFLGYLRAALGPQAAKALRGTIDKDLAAAPIPTVVEHLRQHWSA